MLTRRTLTFAAVGATSSVAGGLLWQLQKLPPAPSIAYTLLDGQPRSSADWRGSVMLVNFWATSCATCVKEMPVLISTYRKYQSQGYDTLAVAMQYDPPEYVSRFVQSRQLPFGVAVDTAGAISQAFGDVRVTPTSVLIDREGRIVKTFVGELTDRLLHPAIEKWLAG